MSCAACVGVWRPEAGASSSSLPRLAPLEDKAEDTGVEDTGVGVQFPVEARAARCSHDQAISNSRPMVALVLRSSVAVECLFRSSNLRRLLLALRVIQGLQRFHGLLHWLSQRIVCSHARARLKGRPIHAARRSGSRLRTDPVSRLIGLRRKSVDWAGSLFRWPNGIFRSSGADFLDCTRLGEKPRCETPR